MSFIAKLLKSKTVIVNSLTVVVGVLGYLAGHEVIAQYPEVVAGLISAVGVVNLALRFLGASPSESK